MPSEFKDREKKERDGERERIKIQINPQTNRNKAIVRHSSQFCVCSRRARFTHYRRNPSFTVQAFNLQTGFESSRETTIHVRYKFKSTTVTVSSSVIAPRKWCKTGAKNSRGGIGHVRWMLQIARR